MTYIQRHTNRPITIEQVAEHIHRSPSYLMKRFREETGQSVGAYITRCKMEEAEDLLIYSSQSLAEISAYLGYSSQSYFQNVFKKHFGMTPLQYRTQKKQHTALRETKGLSSFLPAFHRSACWAQDSGFYPCTNWMNSWVSSRVRSLAVYMTRPIWGQFSGGISSCIIISAP